MLAAGEQAKASSRSKADIQNIIGLGLVEAVRQVWPNESEQVQGQIIAHYKEIFMGQSQYAPEAYPNVMDGLIKLHQQNYQMAVATGKARRGLDRALKATQTDHLFHASRCADETTSKPDPLMLHELLAELDVAVHEAVMVGDTEYDLLMAKAMGMKSIGVSYGAHSVERLLACSPAVIIDDFSQIHDVLKEWV